MVRAIPRGTYNIPYLDFFDVFQAALFTFRYGFRIRILNDGPEFIPSNTKVMYKCSVELKLPSGSVCHEVGYASSTRGRHGDAAKASYTDAIKRLFSIQGIHADAVKVLQSHSSPPPSSFSPPELFYLDPVTKIRRLNDEEFNKISQRLKEVLSNSNVIDVKQKGSISKIQYLRGSEVSEVAKYVFSHGFSLTTVKEPTFMSGEGIYKCIRRFSLYNGFSLDGVGYQDFSGDRNDNYENDCKSCMTNADKTIFAKLGINVDSVMEARQDSTPPRVRAPVNNISPRKGIQDGVSSGHSSSFIPIDVTKRVKVDEGLEVEEFCMNEELKYQQEKNMKNQTSSTNTATTTTTTTTTSQKD